MFKRKPSPELQAVHAAAAEFDLADCERKSAVERLMGRLRNPLTQDERRAFEALISTDERRDWR